MSIIAEALKKASQEKRSFVVLPPRNQVETPKVTRESSDETKRWYIVGGALLLTVVCIVIALSSMHPVPVIERKRPLNTARNIEVAPLSVKDAQKTSSLNTAPLKPARLRRTNLLWRNSAPAFTLNGVIDWTNEPLAVINDAILGKGDRISGARIVNIDSEKVVLDYKNREIVLYVE